MLDDVVDPRNIVEHCGIDAELIALAAAISEAGDTTDPVYGAVVPPHGAHQASTTVAGARVHFAGHPAGAQHVFGDVELAVGPPAGFGLDYWQLQSRKSYTN